MNGDFGAISVTERSSAVPISKWKGTYEISVHTIPELLFVKGGGGVLDISLGGKGGRGPSYPGPV